MMFLQICVCIFPSKNICGNEISDLCIFLEEIGDVVRRLKLCALL